MLQTLPQNVFSYHYAVLNPPFHRCNTEISHIFWLLQNYCPRANVYALRQGRNVHTNQMLTSTIIWENNFSFYLPSAPSNYFKINVVNSPLCYSCGWSRWLADMEGSCKYATYAITDSCHRVFRQLYKTSRVQNETENPEIERIFWNQKSHSKWMWNLEPGMTGPFMWQVHSVQQQQH